jgi:asparagine synthase (glutamine-hydrolysing)
VCGIFGALAISGVFSGQDRDSLKDLSNRLFHRGPDASGFYVSFDEKVIFFHRRLKIHDLSEGSAQPMSSANGGVTLIFNGEIYNFKAVRSDLQALGYEFKTSGDTEVVLAAYLNWGVEFIDQLDGMYSIAIYDQAKNEVLLYRDYFGEKPLYFTMTDNRFYFSSEMRPLMELQNGSSQIDERGLFEYLSRGYVSGKQTLIKNISKLEKNSLLKINIESSQIEKIGLACVSKSDHDGQERLKVFDQMFGESVRDKLASDVPVGVLLSGGLDSSLVVAKAAEFSDSINTYNISFPESSNSRDDCLNARAIAQHFGTNHSEIELDLFDIDFLQKIISDCDDLINDPSLIPTFMVYRSVAQECKVVLGGDGADEMFGGYRRYFNASKIQFANKLLPSMVKQYGSTILDYFTRPGMRGRHSILSALQKDLKSAINLPTLFSHEQIRSLVDIDFSGPSEYSVSNTDFATYLQIMCDFDINCYMPDNILIKVDRMSMLNSVEARSPFLTKSIFGLSQDVPVNQKVEKGAGKLFLREYAKLVLPATYNFNAKNGFSPPFDEWLCKGRGLRKYAEAILFDEHCKFDNSFVQSLFNDFDKGYKVSRQLLALLFLQFWMSRNNIRW